MDNVVHTIVPNTKIERMFKQYNLQETKGYLMDNVVHMIASGMKHNNLQETKGYHMYNVVHQIASGSSWLIIIQVINKIINLIVNQRN